MKKITKLLIMLSLYRKEQKNLKPQFSNFYFSYYVQSYPSWYYGYKLFFGHFG